MEHRKTIICCLAAVCAAAFLVRVVYPFNNVFGMGFVNFLETDAWNRMWYAKQIAIMLDTNILQAIQYTTHNSLLFPFTVALLSKVFPAELVGAWLPPLLAAGTVLFIYGIGASLFNRPVGILGALFVAIIPSEFLHRSLLGFADHHAMESFLMAATVFFTIKAMQAGAILNRYSIITIVSLFLYMCNWVSGLYLMAALFGFGLMAILGYNLATKQPWLPNIARVAVPVLIGLCIYLPLGGYQHLLWFLPSSMTTGITAVQTTTEIIKTVFSPVQSRTISEIMPLLMPFGSFNIGVVATNLHLFALAVIPGIVLLWKYRHTNGIWLFIAWTILMLVITLNQRRFMYYFTLNVGLLSALALFELGKHIKGSALQNAVLIAIPFIVLSMPFVATIGHSRTFHMSQQWHDALTWLKTQPGEGAVTTWTDYGHWVQYVAEKTPNYTPGPGGEAVARLFLTTNETEAITILDELNTDYLIVDNSTLTNKYFALAFYAGQEVPDRSKAFAYKLFYDNQVPPYLRLVYEANPTLKIFKYNGASYYPPD